MLYCFTYPENIDKYLVEAFEKSKEGPLIEVMKYKTEKEFYISKFLSTCLYLEDGKKLEIEGDISQVLDSKNIVKSYTISTSKYSTTLIKTENGVQMQDLGVEFHVGEIYSSVGKKLGNLLIYKDFKTKEILKEMLKKFSFTEVEQTNDIGWDIISILIQLGRF